jgi:hypothetical protein
MLSLDVELLREFFTAFFANPKELWWRKFLAWDMTKPGQKPYSMSVFMILMFFRLFVPRILEITDKIPKTLHSNPPPKSPVPTHTSPPACSLHDPTQVSVFANWSMPVPALTLPQPQTRDHRTRVILCCPKGSLHTRYVSRYVCVSVRTLTGTGHQK